VNTTVVGDVVEMPDSVPHPDDVVILAKRYMCDARLRQAPFVALAHNNFTLLNMDTSGPAGVAIMP
jgi:hypothetical protein